LNAQDESSNPEKLAEAARFTVVFAHQGSANKSLSVGASSSSGFAFFAIRLTLSSY
jgi:hypothetical protein